jgi:hypothetical protein
VGFRTFPRGGEQFPHVGSGAPPSSTNNTSEQWSQVTYAWVYVFHTYNSAWF